MFSVIVLINLNQYVKLLLDPLHVHFFLIPLLQVFDHPMGQIGKILQMSFTSIIMVPLFSPVILHLLLMQSHLAVFEKSNLKAKNLRQKKGPRIINDSLHLRIQNFGLKSHG